MSVFGSFFGPMDGHIVPRKESCFKKKKTISPLFLVLVYRDTKYLRRGHGSLDCKAWNPSCLSDLPDVESLVKKFTTCFAMLPRRCASIKKVRERTVLLWKWSEMKGEGKTHVDEDRARERKVVWEVWTASWADALGICKEKTEGGVQGSSTCCSWEDA